MTTTDTTTALDQLRELEAEIPKREHEVQEAQVAHNRQIRELVARRGRRVTYFQEVAHGEREADPKEERKLDQAIEEIARHVEVRFDRGAPREFHLPTEAAHAAAIARLDEARGDHARFIDDNTGELLEELLAQAEAAMREKLDAAIAAASAFQAEAQRIGRIGTAICQRRNLPSRMPPSPIAVDAGLAQRYVPLPVALLERLGIESPTATPTTNYIGDES